MNFAELWDSAEVGATVKVRNDMPPPSANTEGEPYRAWRSHNFEGELEAKIDRDGWRFMRFKVDNTTTAIEVDYLAYEVSEAVPHQFELI